MQGLAPILTLWLVGGLLACPASSERRAEWAADWNTRVDDMPDFLSHPCGDFAFDVWADEFLEGCSEPTTGSEQECEERTDWVWARSDQCSVWQDWLLRNHNQRVRDDLTPEPMVKVPEP